MGKRKRRAYYGKVVWPKLESPSESRRRSSDEVLFGVDSEHSDKEEPVQQRIPDSNSESHEKESRDSRQVIDNAIKELLKEEEKDDYRELHDNTDKFPVKKKEAGTRIVSFMIKGDRESLIPKSPGVEINLPITREISSGQVSSDMSIHALSSEKEASGSTSPEVDSITQVIPTDHITFEEGEMGDEYYIARNDSESIVVRQMHPECRVMIPADYETALNEIKTCPLDCPYKALQFAEIDQKTLRSR